MEGSSYALKKLSPHRAGNRYLTEKLVNKAHANTSPLPHLPAQMLSPMEHMNPTLTQQHHVWGLGAGLQTLGRNSTELLICCESKAWRDGRNDRGAQ